MAQERKQIHKPIPQFTSLKNALATLQGNDVRITRADRVFGGDINEAHRLALSDGSQIFMKSNTKANAPFFTAEVAGLAAIAQTGTISTPKILCRGTDEDSGGYSFLLMEFITGGKRLPDCWEIFARELASMHRAPTEDFLPEGKYGFGQDNFIGSGKQNNTPRDSWINFFRDCRPDTPIQQGRRLLWQKRYKKITRLMDRLEDFLTEPEHPSLLHGDLWSGNIIGGNDGKIWLIDPAAYVGHAEADLAMTELFGGFPHNFYAAYREAFPLQSDYESRRDLYHLYHLLNHLNLFGGSYLSSVKRIVNHYARL